MSKIILLIMKIFPGKSNRLHQEKGQATIFMALFMSTMILLFAFTTNIGMLVHAKINLQNAADAAAYAGAAVQARQLTSVAYLNWEMRRAVKEFLYLYMVRGSGDQTCFPRTSTGQRGFGGCPGFVPNGRYGFEFADPRESGTQEPPGTYIPTVCIVFDPNNNYCQKGGVPGVPQVVGAGAFGVADPIVNAVKQSIDTIISKKVADCESRTIVNQRLLISWLFNMDPGRPNISANATDNDLAFDIPGLDGLGILPRMALLRARIDNFEEALNLNLQTEGFSSASIDDKLLSEISSRVAGIALNYYERPVQAFLSAKNNLPSLGDNGIFSDIKLSELIPNQPGNTPANPNLLNPPVLAKFNDIAVKASFANSHFFEDSSGIKGNCKQMREVRTIQQFPIGVTKDPNIITYYAVQLQAKVRLLFSPFGQGSSVAISAYSAAKPFGSRIGKDLSLDKDHYILAMGLSNRGDVISNLSLRFLNLLIADDDNAAAGGSEVGGFSRNDHLGYLRGLQFNFGRRDWAFRLAGAYAPWEIGYFTPPANYAKADGAASNISSFPDNSTYSTSNQFQMEAPIIPFKNPGNGISFIRSRIESFISNQSVADGLDIPAFKALIDAQLSPAHFQILYNFLSTNGLVEHHLIDDPMLNDLPQVLSYIKANNGAKFTVAAMSDSQRRQLTSWNNFKTAADVDNSNGGHPETSLDMGRSSYSVRFVSFDSLQKGGQVVNEAWDNPFARLSGGAAEQRFQADLSRIKH